MSTYNYSLVFSSCYANLVCNALNSYVNSDNLYSVLFLSLASLVISASNADTFSSRSIFYYSSSSLDFDLSSFFSTFLISSSYLTTLSAKSLTATSPIILDSRFILSNYLWISLISVFPLPISLLIWLTVSI